jgi:transcriptional regulator with XRE-family HTH domain
MDDNRIGLGIRAARIRRSWRQVDLARASRVAATTLSRVERGAMDAVSLRTLRTITAALDMRIDLRLRSRDGDVDRLISGRHAALAEAVIGWIRGFDGWIARPEVSFNVFGERGSVDLVAWHAATRTLVVIELKTEIVDVGETIATFDRKVRLAGRIAGQLAWHPDRVGAALVIAGSATNRRRVDDHLATFRSTFPDGIVALRGWLRTPAVAAPSALRALAFFSDNHHRNVRSSYASIRRVRRPPETRSERGASVARDLHGASRSGAAP